MSVKGNASVKTRLIKAARCIKWIVSKTGHVFNNKRQYEKKEEGLWKLGAVSVSYTHLTLPTKVNV